MFDLYSPQSNTISSRCSIICKSISSELIHWMNETPPRSEMDIFALRQFCSIAAGAMKQFSCIEAVSQVHEQTSQWFAALDDNDAWFQMEKMLIVNGPLDMAREMCTLLEMFDADEHLIPLEEVLETVKVRTDLCLNWLESKLF